MTTAPSRRQLLSPRHFFCCASNRTLEPARALAAETLTVERTLSDLVNPAYGLNPMEIDLLWKTAPPRMPIPQPAS
jgi:hypothetical protein